MPTTTETLATARENEVKFATAADQRHAELQAAIDARAELITKAAAGANVKTSDLATAETKIREAESAHLLAKAIHGGATTARHKAEVAAWVHEAAEIEAVVNEAVAARLKAARQIDIAFNELQSAITAYNSAGSGVVWARQNATYFNSAEAARNSSNPLHAELSPKPHVSHQYNAPIGQLTGVVFEANGWVEAPATLKDFAAREAAKWGILPDVAEQAA